MNGRKQAVGSRARWRAALMFVLGFGLLKAIAPLQALVSDQDSARQATLLAAINALVLPATIFMVLGAYRYVMAVRSRE